MRLRILSVPRRCEGTVGGVYRRFSENGPVFIDPPNAWIMGNQLTQFRLNSPADGSPIGKEDKATQWESSRSAVGSVAGSELFARYRRS